MVNSKRRQIVERYRSLLENNLVLTEQFFLWFKARRIFPDFVLDEIQNFSISTEKNRKFLDELLENNDASFPKFYEGLIINGQPFLGELIEAEDKKTSDGAISSVDVSVIDDELMKKCPAIDKLRPEMREKLKNFIREQLIKLQTKDTWMSQNQVKTVEMINLKRQHYDTQQKLMETLDDEKRQVINLKDSLRKEEIYRQSKEEEMKELKIELSRLQSDFEYKISSQMRMNDANTRSVFKMHDKISLINEWFNMLDTTLRVETNQSSLDSDSVDQLRDKLKLYTAEIESLKHRGVGSDQLREELHESIFTSRFLPIEDRKNQPFHDFLIRLFGENQVRELASICSKDVLQSKLERDQTNEIRQRDIRIEELEEINRNLKIEIDRLKSSNVENNNAAAAKPQKSPSRTFIPPTVQVVQRDKNKGRQTLKPMSVQFGTKPNGN